MQKLKKIGIYFVHGIIGFLLFYITLCVVIILITEAVYAYHQWKVGDHIIVSVIDSGIDATHPAFKDKLIYSYDILDWDKTPEDTSGHGTHMASVITQNAPNAKIMPVRNLGGGKTKFPFLNTGFSILYSVLRGADVVNMSYTESEKKMTKLAIWYGRKKGVIFVSSAGNEGEDALEYPAKIKGVISVSAVDKKDRLFKNSNIGRETIFATQGVKILGADYEWAEKQELLIEKTGTSISSAYLSGIIAYLLEQDPTKTQQVIEKELKKYSHSLYDTSQRPTEKLKIVRLEKIQANYEQKPYVHIITKETKTRESRTTITVDALNADSLTIKDAKATRVYDAQKPVTVEVALTEGYNYIEAKITANGDEVIDYEYLLKDTTSPSFDYYGVVTLEGEKQHVIWITDYEIQRIEVNGKDAKDYLRKSLGQKPFALQTYTLSIPETEERIHVRVQDGMGYVSEMVFNE